LSLYLDQGNLELRSRRADQAEIYYREGLAIREASSPTHNLVAALYFKLGLVEMQREAYKSAM